MNNTDTTRRNLALKRANRDIRQMREQIDALKNKLCARMIDRANLLNSELCNGDY